MKLRFDKMKPLIPLAAIGVLLASTSLAPAAEMGAVDEPIKLAVNEATGQHITTRIGGEILKRMGYKVDYVIAGYYPQMTALQDNTLTASLEIWSSNMGEVMTDALNSGNVVKIGDLGVDPIETWHYNNAAKEACPGLPNWEALRDCADKFVVAETYPDGRLLDYPVEWGTTNGQRLKALGLPFKSVPAGSEGSLIVEIKAAEQKNEPLLLMFWSPHWLHDEVELHRLDWPAYFEGCYDDASLGVNPDATYDCDWLRGRIEKIAWVGMQEKWPAAYALLENYKLSNEIQIGMMTEIDANGQELEDVVAKWVDENEAVWRPWIEDATK